MTHNPPAPEVLDLCDELGMLVIDELFDIWKHQKYDKVWGYHRYWDEWAPGSRSEGDDGAARANRQQSAERSSYFGLIDLAGFPKDAYYLYQSHWAPETKMAHILPHWNWKGREGEVTSCHGREKNDFRFVWEDVKYAPGTLEVKVTKNGKAWATAKRVTTGETVAIAATSVDRKTLKGNGTLTGFYELATVDKAGTVVPTDCREVEFSVTGAARLVGFCNGNPIDWTSLQDPKQRFFIGRILAVLRGEKDQEGPATVTVSAQGLKPLKLDFEKAVVSTQSTVEKVKTDAAGLEAAVKVLLSGGVVVIPTDTVYGLAAHPDFPEAVERLYTIKQRDAKKPIALLSDAPEVSYADDPERTVRENALAKGAAVKGAHVLSADTIVWFDNRIYGKPRDLAEAKAFLRELSGRTHIVFTGVAYNGEVKVVRSAVTFQQLTDAVIDEYVARVRPTDRAGAYDIDESGNLIVAGYTGSYENIMGLPVEPLKEWGIATVPKS
ncbi:unnamed protein product [Cylicocyclus nassatus]|uniref:Threonylcarbamoyl-AMP synthase n=1 Tax=Cylicocyclus nassatus TaxID=53992 RepID=A0AA36GQH5_CYLNA|nr:unnamed protein product [Cylicocyclus nassatus]